MVAANTFDDCNDVVPVATDESSRVMEGQPNWKEKDTSKNIRYTKLAKVKEKANIDINMFNAKSSSICHLFAFMGLEPCKKW